MSLALLALLGCHASNHPVDGWGSGPTGAAPTAAELAAPGPLVLETLVGGKATVSNAGLINLEDPRAAEIQEAKVPVALLAHLLRHPTRGDFLVDTGVALDEAGAPEMIQGLVAKVFVVSEGRDLGEDLAARDVSLNGLFLTHMHLDHVLGLSDIPVGVPIVVGPDEQDYHMPGHTLLRPTYRRALDGRPPLRTPDFSGGTTLAGFPAVDFFGDGSLWVMHARGHTPGSLVFLARTTEGPVLLLGDSCHTRWGWEHGVGPGSFSYDIPTNQAVIDALHAFFDAVPGLRAIPGHEL